MSLIEIPFDKGMSEAADVSQLERGVFRTVENMRLDRDGRLVPRPDTAALTQTNDFGSALTFNDLHVWRESLIAIGGTDSTLDEPAEAFRYVGPGLSGGTWRRSANGGYAELPFATNIRDLPVARQLDSGVKTFSCAAGGGYVCVAWAENTSAENHGVQVIRASDGAIVFQGIATVNSGDNPYRFQQVVWCNDGFVLVGLGSDLTEVGLAGFRPATDTQWQSLATSLGGASASAVTALGIAVSGTSVVVSFTRATPSTSIFVRTYSGGALSGATSITGIDGANGYNAHGLATNGTSIVLVARLTSNGRCTAWTYPIGGGAATAGPTTDIFGAFAGGHTNNAGDRIIGVAIGNVNGTTGFTALESVTTTSTTQLSIIVSYAVATHAAIGSAGLQEFRAYRATAAPVMVASGTTNGTVLLFAGNTGLRTTSAGELLNTPDNSLIQIPLQNSASPARMVAATLDYGLGFRAPSTANNAPPAVCVDSSTGKYYWPRYVVVPDGGLVSASTPYVTLAVAEFDFYSLARRQSAEIDGQLLIAGGGPLVYAGELAPYDIGLGRPFFGNLTPSNGAGSLTNSATYNYVAVATWTDSFGRKHRSPPSLPRTVSTGATDDTVTLTVVPPKTMKVPHTIELYRTLFSDGVPGATFHLTATAVANITAGAWITALDIVDVTPDSDLASTQILYTQSQTPVEHHAPLPFKYIAAGRARAITGGLANETQVQFTKLTFPAEPIEFANPGLLAFSAFINEPVTAVFALDDSFLVASARYLYRIAGAGPGHSGQGEFTAPERIPGLGGVSRWQSIAETPGGYFFQSSDDRLLFLSRDGSVSWAQGQAVRDTLALFPVIQAAAYCRAQNAVFFGCTNALASDGRTLVFDLRREVWYTWTSAPFNAVKTIVDQNGLVTVLNQTGTILQESAGTYLAAGGRVETGNIKNGSFASWNALRRIGIRGYGLDAAGSVTVSVDYDDGAGFVSLGVHTTSTTAPFIKYWVPGARKVDSFRVRIDAVDVALNALVLDIEPRRGHSRRAAGDQK